jgi:hypothetical protein
MKRILHPVLGPIVADSWEWRVQREVNIPCTGYATKEISIVQKAPGGPTPQQLAALMTLVEAPASFRNEIARAVFRAYKAEIHPEYFKMLSDTRYQYGVTLAALPAIEKPDEVWKFITRIYSVWVSEDATVDVQFTVTFDVEHELHVELHGKTIDSVYME